MNLIEINVALDTMRQALGGDDAEDIIQWTHDRVKKFTQYDLEEAFTITDAEGSATLEDIGEDETAYSVSDVSIDDVTIEGDPDYILYELDKEAVRHVYGMRQMTNKLVSEVKQIQYDNLDKILPALYGRELKLKYNNFTPNSTDVGDVDIEDVEIEVIVKLLKMKYDKTKDVIKVESYNVKRAYPL